MLTKDILKFRTRSGKIYPQFTDMESDHWLRFAADLLKCYSNNEQNRSELQQQTSELIATEKDIKTAKGFNKVLLDNSLFAQNNDNSISEARKDIFKYSTECIKTLSSGTKYLEFDKIISKYADQFSISKQMLYSDLPEYDSFQCLKDKFTPASLIEKYNCVLAQSLLLYSGSLEVKLYEPDPKIQRGIFRFLKFFRLLAYIEKKGKNFILKIDGPSSIFSNSKKYGLQLASFFPVLCHLKKWELKTELTMNERKLKLTLSDKDNLKSHYKTPYSYVPEEIKIFENYFNSKTDCAWTIRETKEFIDIGNQSIIFPDFTFHHSEKNISIQVELFHRWHHTQLLERLNQINGNMLERYVLGIDRYIFKKYNIEGKIKTIAANKINYFLFTDFPGVKNTLACLKKYT